MRNILVVFCGKALMTLLSTIQDCGTVSKNFNASFNISYESDNTLVFQLVMLSEHQFNQIEDRPKSQFDKASVELAYYRAREQQFFRLINTMVQNPQPIQSPQTQLDLNGANIANFVVTAQSGSRVQAVQHNHNHAFMDQSLAEAAEQIRHLLQILHQWNPDAGPSEKRSFVNSGISSSLKRRAANALQAGGEAILTEVLDNAYVNIALSLIKGWQQD